METYSQYSNPDAYYEQPNSMSYGSLQAKNAHGRNRALSATASVKLAKSNGFFKTTRVDSCPYVVVKNGVAQAIPFYPKKKDDGNIPLHSQSENQYVKCP